MENYKIIKYISEGGFGIINLAKNKNNKKYILKFLKNEEIFNNELKSLKILSKGYSKNYIPKIIDFFIGRNGEYKYCIVMEFIEGITLKEYIKNKIDEYKLIDIIYQLLIGLYLIHKDNIVHRDIKLENIMITNNSYIKFIDFGLSCDLNNINCLSKNVGSIGYYSPETYIMKRKFIDHKKNDVWMLGITLFKLITNKYPFYSSDNNELKNLILESNPFNSKIYNYIPSIFLVKNMLIKDFNDRCTTFELINIYMNIYTINKNLNIYELIDNYQLIEDIKFIHKIF